MTETLQIQLPSELIRQMEREISSDKLLDEAIAEAIQMWLERREQEKATREHALSVLRTAGVVMTSGQQHRLAHSMMPEQAQQLSRAQVEAALAKLKVPLSEEILAMRGAR